MYINSKQKKINIMYYKYIIIKIFINKNVYSKKNSRTKIKNQNSW